MLVKKNLWGSIEKDIRVGVFSIRTKGIEKFRGLKGFKKLLYVIMMCALCCNYEYYYEPRKRSQI